MPSPFRTAQGDPVTPDDFRRRLEERYIDLSKRRGGSPVYGIEHGLEPNEINQLKVCLGKIQANQMCHYWSLVVAWASEVAFGFQGNFHDQFGNPFRGAHHHLVNFIVNAFNTFQRRATGRAPFKGEWQNHWTVICQPLSNALVPASIARHLIADLGPLLTDSPSLRLAEPEEIVDRLLATPPAAALANNKAYMAFRQTREVVDLAVRFALDLDLPDAGWIEDAANQRLRAQLAQQPAAIGAGAVRPHVHVEVQPSNSGRDGWRVAARLIPAPGALGDLDARRYLLRGVDVTLGGAPVKGTAFDALFGNGVRLDPWNNAFNNIEARFDVAAAPQLSPDEVSELRELLARARLPWSARLYSASSDFTDLVEYDPDAPAGTKLVLWSPRDPNVDQAAPGPGGWERIPGQDSPPLWIAESTQGAHYNAPRRGPAVWVWGRRRPHRERTPLEADVGEVTLAVRMPSGGKFSLRVTGVEAEDSGVEEGTFEVAEQTTKLFTLSLNKVGMYLVEILRDRLERPVYTASLYVSNPRSPEVTAVSVVDDAVTGPPETMITVKLEADPAVGLNPWDGEADWSEEASIGEERRLDTAPMIERVLKRAAASLQDDWRRRLVTVGVGTQQIAALRVEERAQKFGWVTYGAESYLRQYSGEEDRNHKAQCYSLAKPWTVKERSINTAIGASEYHIVRLPSEPPSLLFAETCAQAKLSKPVLKTDQLWASMLNYHARGRVWANMLAETPHDDKDRLAYLRRSAHACFTLASRVIMGDLATWGIDMSHDPPDDNKDVFEAVKIAATDARRARGRGPPTPDEINALFKLIESPPRKPTQADAREWLAWSNNFANELAKRAFDERNDQMMRSAMWHLVVGSLRAYRLDGLVNNPAAMKDTLLLKGVPPDACGRVRAIRGASIIICRAAAVLDYRKPRKEDNPGLYPSFVSARWVTL